LPSATQASRAIEELDPAVVAAFVTVLAAHEDAGAAVAA
jgi:hypothetical protein